jgi:ankyrin repeat protein
MGIARFMSEIVNAQDSAGDTALNIAARIGNRSIISQLIEVGADPKIANRVGLRPLDFGIGTDDTEPQTNGDAAAKAVLANIAAEHSAAPPVQAGESSDDIIACEY